MGDEMDRSADVDRAAAATTSFHEIGSVRVPPMALGTMYFGTSVSREVAHQCLDVAAAEGATFWDTANNYAFWAGGTGDESETVLGEWFSSRGSSARDGVVLATKVGARPAPGHADLEHTLGLSARAVRQQLHDCLRRLRTDRVDVLYAHMDDRDVPVAETLGAFSDLVDEGVVREVAASNFSADRLGEALAAECSHPYRALQQRFTYLQTDPEADTGPQIVLDGDTENIASANGVTLVGYSPLLSGAYTRSDRELPAEYTTTPTAAALSVLGTEARAVGLDAGQMVLSWMVHRPTPVIPIVGVSDPEQLRSAWRAVRTPLSEATVAALETARSAR